MTFTDIVKTILDYAGQPTGSALETMVKVLVNGEYQRVLSAGNIPHESRVFTLTTVADTYQYGFPLYVKKVLNIEDPTNKKFVYYENARFFDKNYPGTTESGTPTFAFPLGVRGVQANPAADGVLSLVSDSSDDAGSNFKIRVTGYNTSGVLVTEQVTMNGTTEVNTSNSFDSTLGLERVVKEPATNSTFAGNITVTDSSGNTLLVMPVWWLSPDYQWVQFHPRCGSAVTYNVRSEMRKPPLVNDTDWPAFDSDYHMMLVFGVTKDLLPTFGKTSVADRHRDTYDEMMRALKASFPDEPSEFFTFSDVQSRSRRRQRPQRPLIEGVDYGLVTSS